jgi:hypothetical protein
MVRKGIERLKEKYVEYLLDYFHEHNRGKDYGVEAIRALFRLSEEKGPREFIHVADLQRVGIPFGIARWVATGVIEKAKGRRAYRITEVFYNPTKRALGAYAQHV